MSKSTAERQVAPAQGGVQVLQVRLCSWCFLHQGTLSLYYYSVRKRFIHILRKLSAQRMNQSCRLSL